MLLTHDDHIIHDELVTHGHEHTAVSDSSYNFWEEYMHLLGDPAHWVFEITSSIVFDLLVVALIYGIVIKKFVMPRLRAKISKEMHDSHGLEDDHCEPDNGPSAPTTAHED